MAKLDVRIYGDPVLHETARPITRITERHRQLAQEMIETMYAKRGIGLAANQVGITERMIVVDTTWAERNGRKPQPKNPTVMINPVVLEEGVEDDVYSEGCLSLPEIEGDVWRPTQIRFRYQTLEGETIEREAVELEARCVMHEVDHLDGILFIDRMAPDERERMAGKLQRLRKSQQTPANEEEVRSKQ